MAAAQKELVRNLVERSYDRVVQVRAGTSLRRVLQQEESGDTPALTSQKPVASTALPLLQLTASPPPAPVARHARRNSHVPGALDSQHPHDTLPGLALDNAQLLDATPSSYQQYQRFMDSKAQRAETLHQRQRRQALVPRAVQLKKLAAVCAAAMAELEGASEIQRESLRIKLLRAMAMLRGGRAFVAAKSLAAPAAPVFAEMKNAHMAFLEFKRDGAGSVKNKRGQVSFGLQDGNTAAKTPIHFGDQICLLSTTANLPLAVGANGRSRAAEDLALGPQMTFTIVDFRNPSRNGEVTATDDFWLRVDATALAPRKRINPRRPSTLADDSDGGADVDDVEALLSDTSYFLGCPGWLDDGIEAEIDSIEEPTTKPKTTVSTKKNVQAQALENRQGRSRSRSQDRERFRLVAMKASTPSRDLYGDDKATREYAVEINDSVMRLARWRFVRYVQRRHERQAGEPHHSRDDESDVNDAMLNCSTVYLALSDFALVYDEELQRGVGQRVASDNSAAASELLLFKGKKARRDRDGAGAADLARLSACARWQVRLLKRTGGTTYLQELEAAMAAVGGTVGREDDRRVEWLRKKQAQVARNDQRLREKHTLVSEARRQYNLVAAQSNDKLEQIERRKAGQATEYFQKRLQVLAAEHQQPHEAMRQKQRQLQSVVELPRL